jgi:hypothetical protein
MSVAIFCKDRSARARIMGDGLAGSGIGLANNAGQCSGGTRSQENSVLLHVRKRGRKGTAGFSILATMQNQGDVAAKANRQGRLSGLLRLSCATRLFVSIVARQISCAPIIYCRGNRILNCVPKYQMDSHSALSVIVQYIPKQRRKNRVKSVNSQNGQYRANPCM